MAGRRREGPGAGGGRVPEGPVVLVVLDGGADAGFARTGALRSLLEQSDGEVVARMRVDEFVDPHRAPPALDVEHGLLCGVTWPDLEVRRGVDRAGRPWAVAHGPEPTLGWRRFADELADLAAGLGARCVVTLGSAAAATSPTDPVRVLAAATEPRLLAGSDPLDPALTPLTGPEAALAQACADRGIGALALVAPVPGYLARAPFPAAAAALLVTVGRATGVTFETGALRAGARVVEETVRDYLAEHAEYAEQVRAVDAYLRLDGPAARTDGRGGGATGPAEGGAVRGGAVPGGPGSPGHRLAEELEQYLRDRSGPGGAGPGEGPTGDEAP